MLLLHRILLIYRIFRMNLEDHKNQLYLLHHIHREHRMRLLLLENRKVLLDFLDLLEVRRLLVLRKLQPVHMLLLFQLFQ